MLRSLKWYYKLAIIFLIMIIFYAFTNKGFILNVKAESFNREVLFYNDLGIQQQPTLLTSGDIFSNYLSQEDLDKISGVSGNNYALRLVSFYNNIDTSTGEVYSRSTQVNTYLDGTHTLNHSSSGNGNFITKFLIKTNTQGAQRVPVSSSHKYTILLEFSRDSVLFYKRGEDYSLNDFDIGGQLSRKTLNNTYVYYDLVNYVNYDSVEWLTPNLGDDDTPYSFLKISFTTNTLPNTDIYLDNIYIGLKNDNDSVGDFVDISGGYNFFIANTNDTNNGVFTTSRVFFIEDLSVLIGDIDYSGASGSPLSSTRYRQCDTLDIACHVDNIYRGIKSITENLIHSIRYLFSYLFIPNYNDIALMFSDFHDVLLEKLGFLGYFIDLTEDFVGEITTITIDNDPAITLPPLKEPFSNTVIWNGGTYYIKYYMTYGALGTLYNIYYLFISAYLIFLFINFCIDSIDDIFVGRVGGNLTGNMLEEINDSDYTPQHEYTGRHSEAHTSLYRHLRDRR